MSFSDPRPPANSSFGQGFVVGQLVLLVVLVFVFRYFYVADVPESLERQRQQLIERTAAQQKSLAARSRTKLPPAPPYPPNSLHDVLARTNYSPGVHPPESLEWLSVIAAQTIANYRAAVVASAAPAPGDASAPLPSQQTPEKAALKGALARALNAAVTGRTFNVLDHITVTDVAVGTQFPRFGNARIHPDETGTCARLYADFDYVDQVSIGIDTRLLMNFAQLRFGTLALAMTLRVERLAGTIAIEVGPQRVPGAHAQEVRVSVAPDFVLDAHLSSIIGSKDKLQDVPKIEELLITRMRMFVAQRLVWPHYWSIPLPRI